LLYTLYYISILYSILLFFFFFMYPSPSVIYTLSLHDALPIWLVVRRASPISVKRLLQSLAVTARRIARDWGQPPHRPAPAGRDRSEEHTSELQSRFDLVCRLLLEKKKKKNKTKTHT